MDARDIESAKRAKQERWHQHLEDLLTRADARVEEAERRVAAHRKLMAMFEAQDERQMQISIALHRNLEESLDLLRHHREMVGRELNYSARQIEREYGDLLRAEYPIATPSSQPHGSSRGAEA